MQKANWEAWVEDVLSKLEAVKLLGALRPINLRNAGSKSDAVEVFEGLRQWDRTTVHVRITELTYHKWLNDIQSCGETVIDDVSGETTEVDFNSQPHRRLVLFSGNDFLALSSHPAIRRAAAKAAQEYGMGPRGSAINCGYTDFHWLLEARLAALKKKEDCLLCPTGFAANMALMVAIGSVASVLASTKRPSRSEKVAVFSDALNHASIIDGLLLAERQNCVEVFVYRHCDMQHLNTLLSECTIEKKAVVTDSIFSMDGDFAPIDELAKLRKKHGFLLVIDDSHGTFVCGKHGGGVAEVFNCEKDVDICIGTLSKGAGCFGGFIACRVYQHMHHPIVDHWKEVKRILRYLKGSISCGLTLRPSMDSHLVAFSNAGWDFVDLSTIFLFSIEATLLVCLLDSKMSSLDPALRLNTKYLHLLLLSLFGYVSYCRSCRHLFLCLHISFVIIRVLLLCPLIWFGLSISKLIFLLFMSIG